MNAHFQPSLALTLVALFACGCAAVDDQRANARPPRFDSTFSAELKTAGGKYEHEVNNSIDGDAPAGLVALEFEGHASSDLGGGVALEYMSSSDHLFSGQAATQAHAESFNIAPYLLYRASAGNTFRMPIKFGPWVNVLTLEDQGSTDSTQWVTYGLRLALEPEIVIEQSQEFEWSLFSSVSFAGGATRIDLESAAGDEEFDSHASAVGFEVGPRIRWSRFCAGISFIHRGVFLADGGPVNNLSVDEVNSVFNGLAVYFGGGF